MLPKSRRFFSTLSVVLVFALIVSVVTPRLTNTASAAPLPVTRPFPGVQLKHALFPGMPASRVELPLWNGTKTRQYLNPDGTFTAEVYRDSINYQDPATHVWKPIDNSLKAAREPGFAFSNGANRFGVHFGASAGSGTLARIRLGDSYIDFSPVNSAPTPGRFRGTALHTARPTPTSTSSTSPCPTS